MQWEALVMQSQPPKTKYVPHKTLVHGSSFIAMADSDCVLEVHIDVNKVNRVLDEKGSPAVLFDGRPIYSWESSNRATILTKEEWLTRKQLLENGEF